MRFSTLILSALLLPAASAWADDQPVPQSFKADRYQRLIAHSPFSVASEIAPVAQPDFAQNLYVTAIARVGNEDMVFIASRGGDQGRLALFGKQPAKDGTTLESVEWSPTVGKSRVVLKKGGQTGTVNFDEMAIRAASPALPVNPAAAMNPGLPNANQARGMFPRAGGGNNAGNDDTPRFNRGGGGGNNGGQGNGNFPRRRSRVVPAGGGE